MTEQQWWMQAAQRERFPLSSWETWSPGDYVMVHAGVAIAKITDDDEEETDQLMEELL